jgi:aspartyl-tRNA(Asn)/glutamyl-tRNA(Gln) amidotransferase subunit C
MKLELEQVRHVAKLARLALTSDEEARFSTQLSAVLDAVESLATVNTEGVPVTTLATMTAPRPDEVRDELPVEVALKNAPQKEGSSFAIPRVIE